MMEMYMDTVFTLPYTSKEQVKGKQLVAGTEEPGGDSSSHS